VTERFAHQSFATLGKAQEELLLLGCVTGSTEARAQPTRVVMAGENKGRHSGPLDGFIKVTFERSIATARDCEQRGGSSSLLVYEVRAAQHPCGP
jgi:hypothetical protein